MLGIWEKQASMLNNEHSNNNKTEQKSPINYMLN